MRQGDLVRLDVPIKRINDPHRFIELLCKGKKVLNVGAGGGVRGYLPLNKGVWLHERLRKASEELVGIDIDVESIDYAKKHGYVILQENCEDMSLGRKFDVIVMSDVIEHVNAPVIAIKNLLSHISEDGMVVITTPNATSGNAVLRTMFRRRINVFFDHVAIYYPEHFQAICERLGCTLDSVYVYDHVDRRNLSLRVKSMIFRCMTLVSPRMGSTLMIIIRKERV